MVKALDLDIMELPGQEVLLGEDHLLPLEAEVEDEAQVARVGHHQRQVLMTDIGVSAQQETLGIGRGEADMDLLGDGGLIVALEVVLDHVVGPHVDANLVGTDRTLERSPTAVASEVIVTLGANSSILARIL